MSRKNAISLALEENDVVETSGFSEDILHDGSEEDHALLAEMGAITEGVSLAGVIEANLDSFDEALQTEQGPSAAQVAALESLMAHACERLGIDKTKSAAFEGISDHVGQKDQLAQVLQKGRELQTVIDRSIIVATESMTDRVDQYVESIQENVPDLIASISSAMAGITGEREGEVIDEPWAKGLGVRGTADARSVEGVLTVYQKQFGDSGILKEIGRVEQAVARSTKQVRGIWFFSTAKEINVIESAIAEIKDVVEKIPALESNIGGTKAKLLSKADAVRIGESAIKLLKTRELDEAIEKITSSHHRNAFWCFFNTMFRVKSYVVHFLTGGLLALPLSVAKILPFNNKELQAAHVLLSAEDLAKARKAASAAWHARNQLIKAVAARNRLARACIRYIRESA